MQSKENEKKLDEHFKMVEKQQRANKRNKVNVNTKNCESEKTNKKTCITPMGKLKPVIEDIVTGKVGNWRDAKQSDEAFLTDSIKFWVWSVKKWVTRSDKGNLSMGSLGQRLADRKFGKNGDTMEKARWWCSNVTFKLVQSIMMVRRNNVIVEMHRKFKGKVQMELNNGNV